MFKIDVHKQQEYIKLQFKGEYGVHWCICMHIKVFKEQLVWATYIQVNIFRTVRILLLKTVISLRIKFKTILHTLATMLWDPN